MNDRYLKHFLSALMPYRTLFYYGAIGLSALITELALFYALNTVLGLDISSSNGVAMGSGFIVSFTLNALYNFKVKNKLLLRLLQFAAITFCGYWLSTFTIVMLIGIFSMSALFAKLCSIPAFFLFQYTLNKRYTFQSVSGKIVDNPAPGSSRPPL